MLYFHIVKTQFDQSFVYKKNSLEEKSMAHLF